jgi:protein O-mannosyl-transferase
MRNHKQAQKYSKRIQTPQDDLPKTAVKAVPGLNAMWLAIVFVFAVLLYSNTFNHNYALDDEPAITKNKLTTQGVAGIPEMFTTGYWYGWNGKSSWGYRPVPLMTYAIEWQIWPSTPAAGHIMNAVYYGISLILLLLLMYHLTGKKHPVFAIVVTLLFAAHPVHTESVANIKGRDEILCFLFLCGSMLALFRYNQTKNILMLITSALTFFFALLSKETAITFLAVIPVTVYLFATREIKRVFGISSVFMVVAGIYMLIRKVVLTDITGSGSLEAIDNLLMAAPDLSSRLATAISILGRYFYLLVIPHPLSYDYSFNQIPILTFSDPGAWIPAIIIITMAIVACVKLNSWKWFTLSVVILFASLSISSNIFFIIGSPMAERFLFIPSLAVCIILGYVISKAGGFIYNDKTTMLKPVKQNRAVLLALLIPVMGLYSFKTITRNADWKDNATLFKADLHKSPKSARTNYNYGWILVNQKFAAETNPAKRDVILNQAINLLSKAVQIFPDYSHAWINLGEAYHLKHMYPEALYAFEQEYRLNPDKSELLIRTMGRLYGMTGNIHKSIEFLGSALLRDSLNPETHNYLGVAYAQNNEFARALPHFLKAKGLNPEYLEVYQNLGSAYGNAGDFGRAIEAYQEGLARDSSNYQLNYLLGISWANIGNPQKAAYYHQRAAALKQ